MIEQLSRPAPMAERAYDQLRAALLEMRFRAGERLVETRLSETLGISRTPLRAALARLALEGLVVRSPSGGLVAGDIEQQFADLYGLRARVEGYAAFLAASRVNASELRHLERLLGESKRAILDEDLEGRARINAEFHFAIADAAHSPRISSLVRELYVYSPTRVSIAMQTQHILEQHLEFHSALLERLRIRDGVGAEEVSRQHLSSLGKVLGSQSE